jgi:hypothetical protein
MLLLRCGLVLALALGGAGGCAIGAPDRASDIQNLNAIGDDIAARTMTESPSALVRDPNRPTVIPGANETSYTP